MGNALAGAGLTFMMRIMYGVMNMGKRKKDICPVHQTKRAKGFCFQCSEENRRKN